MGFLLLSSVGLLIYIKWIDISPQVFELRLPPLYEKVRAKENSLSHYKEYEHKTVKYFLAANHFHSMLSRV